MVPPKKTFASTRTLQGVEKGTKNVNVIERKIFSLDICALSPVAYLCSLTSGVFVLSHQWRIRALSPVAYSGILFGVGGRIGSTNSVEGRENGDLGACSPLFRGSAQFANE
jgi:hypothetical protein